MKYVISATLLLTAVVKFIGKYRDKALVLK